MWTGMIKLFSLFFNLAIFRQQFCKSVKYETVRSRNSFAIPAIFILLSIS